MRLTEIPKLPDSFLIPNERCVFVAQANGTAEELAFNFNLVMKAADDTELINYIEASNQLSVDRSAGTTAIFSAVIEDTTEWFTKPGVIRWILSVVNGDNMVPILYGDIIQEAL